MGCSAHQPYQGPTLHVRRGAVYSVTTDFALSFFVSFYDRSLSSLAISFLLSPIDAAIALFVTRRRAVLAHA
jgi:hypothetical protein